MNQGSNPFASPACQYLSAKAGSTGAEDDDFSLSPIYSGFIEGTEFDVLANDTDLEGDSQKVALVDGQAITGDGEVNSITTSNGFKVWRNLSGTIQVSTLIAQPEGEYSFEYTVEDDSDAAAQATATITVSVVKPVAIIVSASHTGSAFQIDQTGSFGPFAQLSVDSDGNSTYDLFSAVLPIGSLFQLTEPFTPGSIIRLQVFADAGGTMVLAEAEKALPTNTIIVDEGTPAQPISWTFSDDSNPPSFDAGYIGAGDVVTLSMEIIGGSDAGTYTLPVAAGFASIDISGLPAGLQAIFSNAANVITATSLIGLLGAEIVDVIMQFNITHNYTGGGTVLVEREDSYYPDPAKLYDDADVTVSDLVEGQRSGELDEFKITWSKFGTWPFNDSTMIESATYQLVESPSNGDPNIISGPYPLSATITDPGTGTVTFDTSSLQAFNSTEPGNGLSIRINQLILKSSAGDGIAVNSIIDIPLNQFLIARGYLQGSMGKGKISDNEGNGGLYSYARNYINAKLFKGDENGTNFYDEAILPASYVTYPAPYDNLCHGEFTLSYRNLKTWTIGLMEQYVLDSIGLRFASRVGNTFEMYLYTSSAMGPLNITGNVNYSVINADTSDVLASGFYTDTQFHYY